MNTFPFCKSITKQIQEEGLIETITFIEEIGDDRKEVYGLPGSIYYSWPLNLFFNTLTKL